MTSEQLIEAAINARRAAYAPYSQFPVGAAVLTESGDLFTGCNVENISFGLTICAERVAVFSAVAAGHRSFSKIAVAADTDEPISPCGACRQVLAEFAPEAAVYSVNLRGGIFEATVGTLLPRARTGILNA